MNLKKHNIALVAMLSAILDGELHMSLYNDRMKIQNLIDKNSPRKRKKKVTGVMKMVRGYTKIY